MKTNTHTTSSEITSGDFDQPLTARLSASLNFWKEDRNLDDYIDRSKLIQHGPEMLLRKMLKLRATESSNEVKVTVSGLSTLLAVNIKTIRLWLKKLVDAGFIIPQVNVWDFRCNFPKKKYKFPATFPGFDPGAIMLQPTTPEQSKGKIIAQLEAEIKQHSTLKKAA